MEATSSSHSPSPHTLARVSRCNQEAILDSFSKFKEQYHKRFDSNRIRSIKEVHQHGICGKNNQGQTVVVDRIGSIRVQALFKLLEEEELIAYCNQRLLHLSEEVLQQGQQLVWVIDLSGKIMQLASKKTLECLEKIIKNATTYFPEMLHKIVFVNTPMLFDTIWAKISHCVPQSTQDKIVMIGEEEDQLFELAPARILPDFLGGNVSEDSFLHDSEQEEQDDSSEEEVDFSSLKNALGSLKLSGGNSLKSVSQTPLNTEADDK